MAGVAYVPCAAELFTKGNIMSLDSLQTKNVNIGFPLSSILTVIFVIAKLLGYFTFSWWIVFSPLIATVAIPLTVLAILAVVSVFVLAIGVTVAAASESKK